MLELNVLSATPSIKDDRTVDSFFKRFAKYDVMAAIFKAIFLNQIFHYTCCTTPQRVTSLWGTSPCMGVGVQDDLGGHQSFARKMT